jgi:threonine dehydrogenase-like Zn-dependent dehydrogenase
MFALEHVRPEGTIVLKSTYAEPFPFNPAAIVVNEINVIGSRCGDIREAVGFLEDHRMPLDRLISATFPLDRAVEAFE